MRTLTIAELLAATGADVEEGLDVIAVLVTAGPVRVDVAHRGEVRWSTKTGPNAEQVWSGPIPAADLEDWTLAFTGTPQFGLRLADGAVPWTPPMDSFTELDVTEEMP